MKLLYTSTSYPPAVGGAQLYLHNLVQRLAGEHSTRVAAFWRSQRYDWLLGTTLRAPRPAPPYTVDGVPVWPLGWTGGERVRALPYVLGFYPLQPWAVRGLGAPLVERLAAVAEPGTDLIHNVRIGREPLTWASWQLARRLDVPFVLTPLHHPRWVGWRYRVYLALYRAADLVLALTEAERETLIGLGVSPDRIAVTGMGPVLAETPPDPDAFRAAHGLGDHPVVLFLGQKYPYKGMAALLEAAPLVWARCPETRFVFVGPRTPASEQLFAGVRDRRVVELPQVDLPTKGSALAAATLLCVPSTQESFGGVYLEAWRFGKPVVGGDIPAIRSVISDGVDGLLTPQAPGPIADRLVRLLGDPALAAALGAAGRHKAETRYAWETLTRMTLDAYQRVQRGG